MIHIPIDSLPATPAVKNHWRRSNPNQAELRIRYTGGLFTTCCLIVIALIFLALCSCRGPLHSNIPCGTAATAGNQAANPAYRTDENNVAALSGSAAAAGYASLPPSAYSGPATGTGKAPITQPGMEQGPPLPVAAYLPWTPPGISPPWPEDECLRDGGDCGVPVGVSDGPAGLQMEDTVAVYDTLDGRTLVTPSNDVYIYSPRFTAVRTGRGPCPK